MREPLLSGPGKEPDLSFEPTLRGLRAGMKVFGNRYRLTRLLGRGGMGVVWLARDEELGKEVALKFLPEYVALDRVALADLKEETKRSLDLTHPHIVRIYTFHSDMENEMAAIAMEYVDGMTLSDHRMEREGRVFDAGDEAFRRWVGQLCEALAYAHGRKRIVHRDLKPSNLMVNGEGELKVTDFGIARSLNESRTRLSRQGGGGGSGGTLPYMSPQQALGERATESDDIYSLGATLYELLTGKPPFYSGEIYEQIKTRIPPPMGERRQELGVSSQREVPVEWEEVVQSCLAKKPQERPPSVAALARMLQLDGEFASHPPDTPRSAAGKPATKPVQKRPATAQKAGTPKSISTWAIAALLGVLAVGSIWWFGLEKPKRNNAKSLVEEARSQWTAGDYPGASATLDKAFAVMPTHAGALDLQREMKSDLDSFIEGALGKADAALARKDLLAAREAYAEVLTRKADHPRAVSGLAGLKDVMGGMDIKSSPPGARVQISGQKDFLTPATVGQLPLGKQSVSLKLNGYDSVTEEVVVRNDSYLPLAWKLERQRGAVSIESVPPQMSCTVRMTRSEVGSDEELAFSKQGRAPLTLEDLPTGDYEVKMTRAGWPDFIQTVSVAPKANVPVSHDFAEGDLAIESTPPGQQAALFKPDGFSFVSGTTPLAAKSVPTGAGYRVVMKRSGWPDFEKTLTLAKGENPAVTHDFAQGGVVLAAEPGAADAQLLGLDGRVIASGKTPLPVKDLPVGKGYTAVLRRAGWPVHEIPVVIEKDSAPTLTTEFAQGSLRVESIPEGCDFELRPVNDELDQLKRQLEAKETRYAVKGLSREENDTLKEAIAALKASIASVETSMQGRAGKTPADLDGLPTGDHKLVLKRAGWPDYAQTVHVVKGVNTPVAWEFGEGTLVVNSTPAGATVRLGSRDLGVTPLRTPIPAGKFEVFLIGVKGYAPKKLEGDMPLRKELSLSATMERLSFASFLGKWDYLHSGSDCKTSWDDDEYWRNWKQSTHYTEMNVEFTQDENGRLGYIMRTESRSESSKLDKDVSSGRWKNENTTSNYKSQTPGNNYIDGELWNVSEVLSVTYDETSQVVTVRTRSIPKKYPGDSYDSTMYYRLDPTGEKLFSFADTFKFENNKSYTIKANFADYGESWMNKMGARHMIYARHEKDDTFLNQYPTYARRAAGNQRVGSQ